MMRTCLAACAALIIGMGVAGAAAPDSRRLSQAKDYIADEQWVRAIDALRAAVADPAEKNRVSHRGKALAELLATLRKGV